MCMNDLYNLLFMCIDGLANISERCPPAPSIAGIMHILILFANVRYGFWFIVRMCITSRDVLFDMLSFL